MSRLAHRPDNTIAYELRLSRRGFGYGKAKTYMALWPSRERVPGKSAKRTNALGFCVRTGVDRPPATIRATSMPKSQGRVKSRSKLLASNREKRAARSITSSPTRWPKRSYSNYDSALNSLVLVVWCCTPCSEKSPFEPQGWEFESLRARQFPPK